jgi:hypothetical protein
MQQGFTRSPLRKYLKMVTLKIVNLMFINVEIQPENVQTLFLNDGCMGGLVPYICRRMKKWTFRKNNA